MSKRHTSRRALTAVALGAMILVTETATAVAQGQRFPDVPLDSAHGEIIPLILLIMAVGGAAVSALALAIMLGLDSKARSPLRRWLPLLTWFLYFPVIAWQVFVGRIMSWPALVALMAFAVMGSLAGINPAPMKQANA